MRGSLPSQRLLLRVLHSKKLHHGRDINPHHGRPQGPPLRSSRPPPLRDVLRFHCIGDQVCLALNYQLTLTATCSALFMAVGIILRTAAECARSTNASRSRICCLSQALRSLLSTANCASVAFCLRSSCDMVSPLYNPSAVSPISVGDVGIDPLHSS